LNETQFTVINAGVGSVRCRFKVVVGQQQHASSCGEASAQPPSSVNVKASAQIKHTGKQEVGMATRCRGSHGGPESSLKLGRLMFRFVQQVSQGTPGAPAPDAEARMQGDSSDTDSDDDFVSVLKHSAEPQLDSVAEAAPAAEPQPVAEVEGPSTKQQSKGGIEGDNGGESRQPDLIHLRSCCLTTEAAIMASRTFICGVGPQCNQQSPLEAIRDFPMCTFHRLVACTHLPQQGAFCHLCPAQAVTLPTSLALQPRSTLLLRRKREQPSVSLSPSLSGLCCQEILYVSRQRSSHHARWSPAGASSQSQMLTPQRPSRSHLYYS
jgi:hypothetical protein